jgi:hypothetical protein
MASSSYEASEVTGSFYQALATLLSSNLAAQSLPVPPPPPSPVIAEYLIVFFDHGSARITPVAAQILENGAQASRFWTSLDLTGSADRSGRGPSPQWTSSQAQAASAQASKRADFIASGRS